MPSSLPPLLGTEAVTYFTCDPRGLCAGSTRKAVSHGAGRMRAAVVTAVWWLELSSQLGKLSLRGNRMWTTTCESWSGALICVHGPCLHANIQESGGQGTEHTRPRGLLLWTPYGSHVAKEATGGNDPLWVPGSHESWPESHNQPQWKEIRGPYVGTLSLVVTRKWWWYLGVACAGAQFLQGMVLTPFEPSVSSRGALRVTISLPRGHTRATSLWGTKDNSFECL